MLMVIVMITGDFLGHVPDHGQSAAIGDAEFLASRQDYDGRRHSGRLLSGVLCQLSWRLANSKCDSESKP